MSAWLQPEPPGWQRQALAALEEDLGLGDPSAALLDPNVRLHWIIEAQAEGVLCGVGIAAFLLRGEGPLSATARDSDRCAPGTKVLEGDAPVAWLLSRERTALNFLMHLSGVATLTARFVEATAGTQAQIVDTRKTLPRLRALQKYAVRCGGGRNHRMGLSDGVMLKDNHLRGWASVGEAVRAARGKMPHTLRLEVECDTLDQAREAVEAGADVILLDNMTPEQLRQAVAELGGRALLEASGGIDLNTVATVAATGVDLISVGALTHSAPALALHLEVLD